MVIAVRPMRMMQVTVHEVIDVVAVRNGLVAAACLMLVRRFMRSTGVRGRARRRVRRSDREHALVGVAFVRVVQVAIVGVVDMVSMPNAGVATAGAVNVVVCAVRVVAHVRLR